MKCVILAGGSGTRFWPLSRSNYPKQLLNIVGKKSMLQMTVDRLKKIKIVSHIYIITRKELYNIIIRDIDGIDPQNIIVEPEGKNTAPAIGMMAEYFHLINPNDIMGVFPADHLIVGHQKFVKALRTADHISRKNNCLVTIGIKPTYPSTAYGYIQYDEKSEVGFMDAYHVKTFAEKPHSKLAKRFINSGDFLWNAGMFFGKVETFSKSLNKYMPELTISLKKIALEMQAGNTFENIWEHIDPESIDYGLFEKAKNIYVIAGDFKWNDIGSWNSLGDVLNENKDGNIIKGMGKILKGNNNLIYSEEKFTAIIGLNDIIVINTKDATLVLDKSAAEDIKDLVFYLNKNGYDDLV
tara:strand:+ start:766 stop:1824 length:1059 start_codon:yes stop_codon:yes gene_type:complete